MSLCASCGNASQSDRGLCMHHDYGPEEGRLSWAEDNRKLCDSIHRGKLPAPSEAILSMGYNIGDPGAS